MVSPYPQGMAPIQQLPSELKSLICEFVGFEAHRTRDYHVSRPDATLSQDDAYTWTPHSLMPDKVRTNTQVYDDLRSLALVSRDFAPPAQRALFAIAALPKPISYFRLLRTLLLLNPERGRLIRCLIPVGPQTFDNDLLRENVERAVWKEFIQMFTPTFCEEEMEMLDLPSTDLLAPNMARSPLVISWNPHPTALKPGSSSPTITAGLDTEAHNRMKPRQFFPRLVAEALEAIIRLCPRLRAFHLLFSQAPSPTNTFHPPRLLPAASFTPWPLSLPVGQILFKFNPLLTTLTIDFRVLTDSSPLRFYTNQSEHRLPSSITHLTLIGSPVFFTHLHRSDRLPSSITHLTLIKHPWSERWHGGSSSLYVLGQWLGENHGLKSLRVFNGLGHSNESFGWSTWNWNTILLKYKHSLEELEVEGCTLLLGVPFVVFNLQRTSRNVNLLRFGETEVLSCLGQMERLKIIKVPLHYLRRVRVEEQQDLMSSSTVSGVEIVKVNEDEDGREVMEPVVRREQDIQLDVEFPVGAERIEVVVPGKVKGFTRSELIIGVRTVVLRGEEAGIEEGAVQGAGVFEFH